MFQHNLHSSHQNLRFQAYAQQNLRFQAYAQQNLHFQVAAPATPYVYAPAVLQDLLDHLV
jgi:hypothetical protein